MRKCLINIRGLTASGKTTAVKQFCERKGFSVKKIEAPFSVLPVSILDSGKIIVMGDYSANGNCLGVDRYRNGKSDIIDCIVELASAYTPDVIIYEHMMGSNTFKGTKEIAEVASAFGYDYFGIYLQLSNEKRLKNLYARAGKNAGTKHFNDRRKNAERAAERLNEAGLRVDIVNVEDIEKDNMWRIVDDAVRTALA